uniref:exosortase C-terminal domain/associated protein EpsI n=1 Tax=Pseudoduganella sp. TaxID=1880898 RepID=UPI0035B239F9
WREDHRQPASTPAPLRAAQPLAWRPLLGAAGAVLLALAAWPLWAARAEQGATAAPPVQLAWPAAGAAQEFTSWQPAFAPATGSLRQAFAGTPPVGLAVLYYRDVPGGEKMISSINRFSDAKSPWRENSVALRDERIGGRTMAVREGLLGVDGRRLLVWQWYWINGNMTSSNYVGKLLQVKEKLMGGSGDGAAVMVFSPYDEDPAVARAALRAFLDSNLKPLDQALASNRRP